MADRLPIARRKPCPLRHRMRTSHAETGALCALADRKGD
jgi:hypothetical protein